MSKKIYEVAVIGGGSAGVMAVQRTLLNGDECLFFPGSPQDRKKSRAFWVSRVENMPAHFNYKKGIQDPGREVLTWLSSGEFTENFHWQKNRGITQISFSKEHDSFLLEDHQGERYFAHFIILCTGVMDRQPVIAGSIAPILPYANRQSADYCLRCDGHHVKNLKTAVIGHNDSAAWVAAMLYERYQPPQMTLFSHDQEFNFSPKVQEMVEAYGFHLVSSPITSVEGNPKEGRLTGFTLESGASKEAEICFISLGMIVYNELALALGAQVDERGFVVTDDAGLTSVSNLYVAGDLRANTRKQIYTAWDTAVSSSDAINAILRRQRREKKLGWSS